METIDLQTDDFILYCEARGLSRKTIHAYEQTIKLFSLYLQDQFNITDAKDIKATHVRHYVRYLRERGKYTVSLTDNEEHPNTLRGDRGKPISMTTISNYVRNLKVFLRFLYKEREIREDIASKIESIKPERKQKRLLSRQDLTRVLRAFDVTTFHGHRDATITKLLLDTGMRVGECLALTPDVINYRHKAILVKETKSGKERFVYFSHEMGRQLKNWLDYCKRYKESEYVFPTIHGTRYRVNNYERALREAGRKVGVELHPHMLRNSFAKYYLMAGGDLSSLSRILGHSSPEVTQRAYLDFTDEEIGRKYQQHSPLTYINL